MAAGEKFLLRAEKPYNAESCRPLAKLAKKTQNTAIWRLALTIRAEQT
jgi:hypothetical protein